MPTLLQLPEGSVCWPASAMSSAAMDVIHARTQIRRPRGSVRGVGGSTRWERHYADATAWVEWDWVEIGEGTVVQADPLNVRSNVLLLDERGRPMLSSRRRATLATLVYLLPWQGPVLDTLRHADTHSPARLAEERLAA
jgi:hypothetical protein